MWGLMSAMPEEAASLIKVMEAPKEVILGGRTYYQGHLWGVTCTLAFSRWGKVAAASTATSLIQHFACTKMIFTGVAGAAASDLKVGDVVIGTRLYQHDMDARPLFSRFEIPLLARHYFETDGAITDQLFNAAQAFAEGAGQHITNNDRQRFQMRAQPHILRGTIASGDKFFARNEDVRLLRDALPEVCCVEMEGAAVGQVCYEHNVPLAVVRTISDSADHAAAIDFQSFVSTVATTYTHEILERFLKSRS